MLTPIDGNTRSDKLWRIIRRKVQFSGARVYDLGCGTGDLMWRAAQEGANRVAGYDIVDRRHPIADKWLKANNIPPDVIVFHEMDLVELFEYTILPPVDVALCFSVLPYLPDFEKAVKWLAYNSAVSFIECQYADDGDGPPFIKDDNEMGYLLGAYGFSHVKAIGKTKVKEGAHERTVWRCNRLIQDC